MADFEELKINVKTEPEKVPAERTRELQNFFRQAGDIKHIESFEKLGRQFKLSETQLKQLAEAGGRPQNAFQALAQGFGRAGALMLVVQATIKLIKLAADQFTEAAKGHIDVQNLATRMGGIHAAQLEADIKAMERHNISRQSSMSMMEKFNEKVLDFKDKTTGFRRSILEDVEGPFVGVVEQHFAELEKAPNLETWMNLVRRFADEIEKYYTAHPALGGAQRGAQERRKYLEKWFGISDIMQMTEDFKQVTQEEKDLWDQQQKVVDEYWRVTTEISQNLNTIITNFLTYSLDHLGIGPALRWLDRYVEGGVEDILKTQDMTPEQREKYYADKLEAREKELREKGTIPLLKQLHDMIFGPSASSRAVPLLGGPLPSDANLLAQEKRLNENIGSLNALLSGERPGEAGRFGPLFHNAPQGGAAGESNPMRIPHHVPQPGGGSAAEARSSIPRPPRPIPTSTSQTFHPTQSTIYYTGPAMTGGQRTKFVQYTDPQTGETYKDYTRPIGPPASHLPDEVPGIAFGYRNFPHHGRETLGGYYLVTPTAGPSAGQSFALAHSDIGPGAGHGEKLDFNAPAAKMVFGSMKESAIHGGSFVKYIGKQLPEGMTAGRQPVTVDKQLGLSKEHADYIREQSAKKMAALTSYSGPGFGGAPASASGAGDERGFGNRAVDAFRTAFDKQLGDELNISGKLNVTVDAPAGTTVNAKGGGMFENAVAIDRRLQMAL